MRASTTLSIGVVFAAVAGACGDSRPAPSAGADDTPPPILELTPAAVPDRPPVVLTEKLVAAIRSRPEVRQVFTRIDLRVAATGSLSLGGRELRVDLVCDGIDPGLASDDYPAFRDWEAERRETKRPPCDETARPACPSPLDYCDARDGTCHRRVPILISRRVVELYNVQYAPAHDLPTIDPTALDAAEYRNIPLTISLGTSFLSGAAPELESPFTVEASLLGVHEHAIPVGMSVPLPYVRRWNAKLGTDAPRGYSRLVVALKQRASLPEFQQWAESIGLRVSHQR